MDFDPNKVNPYDMNSSSFDADKYLQNLIKSCSLKQIMDTETIIVKDTQTLQSEMQTLVYENYNKFIKATETLRIMKTDFFLMENEMKKLQENMIDITSSSNQITSVLHETRTNLTNLTEKSNLLKKLSAISTLPLQLTQLVEEKSYTQAVHEYNKSQWIFQLYGSQTSFKGIQEDCKKIMNDLRVKLKEDFEDKKTLQLTQIGLLLQLGENPTNLSKEILQLTSQRLNDELINLKDQSERDMIEFVDLGIENFLSDLIAISSVYYEMFIAKHFESENDSFQDIARENLNDFVTSNMTLYLNLVHERVDHETESGDCQILLRALDRLNRRLVAMKNVVHGVKVPTTAMDLVIYSIQQFSQKQYRQLKDSFNDNLSSLRLTLVTTVKNNGESVTNLNQLIDSLYENTIEKVKNVLQELAIFLNPEWSFNIKTDHKGMLCVEAIRDHVLITFLRYASSTMTSFSSINSSSPSNLLLVLMKMCLKLEKSGVRTLLMFFDELYEVDSESSSASYETEISSEIYDAAKILLDAYFRVQGMTISQMFRKSVESRDWINCLEPRSVRAVMKRVVDDLTAIETTLDQLLDCEQQVAGTSKSSDSSKKNPQSFIPKQQFRSTLSYYSASQQDSSANLMYFRLFSERVEIFDDLLDFSKVSVLSKIIKISLKTLLECVRLRSFSKFGLQQIQVDTHYLQLNLWRFVADENIIYFLLDDILGSAVLRCYEKGSSGMLMEPNAVELIVERF